MTLSAKVDRYVRSARKSVDGWLTELDARIIALLLAAQTERGVSGCVGEIGVHHGKLALLLHLSTHGTERTFAVDLFQLQEENIDQSGHGVKEKFVENVRRASGDLSAIDIFEENSMKLGWQDIESRTGQSCRFFSVDGGHTRELTVNDLAIANDSLCDAGVICLDDYFNKEFADVSVGLNRFMSSVGEDRLVPVVISDNKVLMCRPEFRMTYVDLIRAGIPDSLHVKDTEFFGHRTPMFRTPAGLYDRLKQSHTAKRLRHNPVGMALKPLVRRLFGKS